MTGNEYQKAIDRLGMSQLASAKFFGVAETTPRRWISGATNIPNSVAMLLTLMVERRLPPAKVQHIIASAKSVAH